MLKRLFCSFLLVLVMSSALCAADAVQEPIHIHTNKSFWSWSNVVVQSVVVGSLVADRYSTKAALRVPGSYEADPLMKGATSTAFDAGFVAISLFVSYELDKHNHHVLSKVVPIFAIAVPHYAVSIHNLNIARR